jgi:hypothetical protein
MDDRGVVEIQIGRPPRSPVVTEARCHLSLPVVIEVPPILDDGTPFPTTPWLSCPLATLRISRLEADGGVRAAEEAIEADAGLRDRWTTAMDRYRRDRDALLPPGWDGPVPRGGIAGSRFGVKCLHAQYADTAAGNDNPIGERVAADIEPLDCATPCVIAVDGRATANPEWVEPR